MTQKLQPVRGTHDILPEEYRLHRFIVDTARKVGEVYGFEEMATPIFEFTEVFKRTLGETSDVVNKEMYTFDDRGGESITLRPEFTAGIARAFISGGLQQNLPLKFFSTGPLFRYERPQKGRLRQFHQINFEWLGNAEPEADAQIIILAAHILNQLGILNKVKLQLNTLGDIESRKNYTQALVSYFNKNKSYLSEDSLKRLEKNPLRILDSKDSEDRKLIESAPQISEFLNQKSKDYFEAVKNKISETELPNNFDINYNEFLVRGLDYYSHTVFEFVSFSDDLGSQNTVLAGGRYDGLIKAMGGPDTPAVGFAAGIERLALMTQIKRIKQEIKIAVVVAGEYKIKSGEKTISIGLPYTIKLRVEVLKVLNMDISVELYEGKNIGKLLGKADKDGCTHALIVGEEEVRSKQAKFKNLQNGEQNPVSLEYGKFAEEIMRLLNK